MLTRKYSKCKDKSVCLGVVASRHPRRGALYSANSLPSHPKPHRILSFAHAHPLSPLESYRFENMGEGLRPSNLPTCALRFELSPLYSHSSALFCTQQKLNFLLFKRFRTLREKTAQRGIPPQFTSGIKNEPSQR